MVWLAATGATVVGEVILTPYCYVRFTSGVDGVIGSSLEWRVEGEVRESVM
jgi:hypothetical protein